MSKEISRAITFINYHIPLTNSDMSQIQYSTVGFFDGMLTELLDVCYEKDGLKSLWQYTLKRTAESTGQYSYQNIFGFADDDWYTVKDDMFWNRDTDRKYPLCFVVFLQTRTYMEQAGGLASVCQKFTDKVLDIFGGKGIAYTYMTIDKNDFVVCIKCKEYKLALEAIKNLHNLGIEIIYSYSVFSISNDVLEGLNEDDYPEIFSQEIESISLKGITNSYDPGQKLRLDQKYYEFCEKVTEKLYFTEPGNGNMETEEKTDGKDVTSLYDVLGAEDFILAARKVNLGRLLQQFSSKGVLHYQGRYFRFYLFASNLVLNTGTVSNETIEPRYWASLCNEMDKKFISDRCNELQNKMSKIQAAVQKELSCESNNEEIVTFCHALWQLLQSLKALEKAPTKKYDFWSLFQPFSLLVKMLENRMEKLESGEYRNQKEEIFDFIHKISMTLHGTLRTDIQFFQIRDFNIIVHYAPAKLRAFYSLWALKLSDYYNSFTGMENSYSFIFSPGMFGKIQIKQLFTDYKENERLMLITVPEYQIYAVKWLSLMLSHEVSHFVGYTLRNREERHQSWLSCSSRILALELACFRYHLSGEKYQSQVAERIAQDNSFYSDLLSQMKNEEKAVRAKKQDGPHEFHSRNSLNVIQEAFRNVTRNYKDKLLRDEGDRIYSFLTKKAGKRRLDVEADFEERTNIHTLSYGSQKQFVQFWADFQQFSLPSILCILQHISAESFADLTAIFTLDLSVKEYVVSFAKSDPGFNSFTEIPETDGILLVVRMALVISAVHNTVVKYKEFFEKTYPDFFQMWSPKIREIMQLPLPDGSVEKKLVSNICQYIQRIRDCKKNISQYSSLYDYEPSHLCFDSYGLDFFNDKYVWEALRHYLLKCSETYVLKLKQSNDLREKKQYISKVYRSISGKSVANVIQQAECFLYDYEQDIGSVCNK